MANKTVTVKPGGGGGDYTSLASALSTESANLVTGTCVLTIECYSMSDTTAADTGTGYTTNATYYINVTVPSAERHSGVWNTGKYRLEVSGAVNAIAQQADYCRFDGLQIKKTWNGASVGVFSGINLGLTRPSVDNEVRVSNCIFQGVYSGGNGYGSGIDVYEGLNGRSVLLAWNCIFYNFYNTDYPNSITGYAIRNYYGHTTAYNCTAYKCSNGFYEYSDSYVATYKNCISACNVVNANYADFGGTPVQAYNLSTDATASGTGSLTNKTLVNIAFTSTTAGSEDLHIGSGSVAVGAGTDNPGSGLYSDDDDIDAQTRTSTWDMGADEYIAAGGGGFKPAWAVRRSRTIGLGVI